LTLLRIKKLLLRLILPLLLVSPCLLSLPPDTLYYPNGFPLIERSNRFGERDLFLFVSFYDSQALDRPVSFHALNIIFMV
jgi:hypothetical protein